MSDTAVRMTNVYKKFSHGERHDSLRDLLPALAKRFVRRPESPLALAKKEFWALQDVSFEIKKGESVGVIGHNGAGKSTMLKHLSGLMRPTSGRLEINGRLSALIEVSAGFHQDLTGRENVFLNGTIMGMSRAEIRGKFDEIVEFSGLAEFIDTPVKRYSSGMYARLGFSVAAHMEPDVLIIDEVLSVGDFVFQAKSLEKMRAVLRGGATVIFVSHNLQAVAELCNRTLLLNHGRLVEDGPTSRVIHAYMDQLKNSRRIVDDAPVVIENVRVGDQDGERVDFNAGSKAWVEVSVRARSKVEKVACVLLVQDQRLYEVFNTSSERLGQAPLTLEPGQTANWRFELDLHLVSGTFHLCVVLHRYDIGKTFDEIAPAVTLVIRARPGVQGVVNLYPKLLSSETGDGSVASTVMPGTVLQQ